MPPVMPATRKDAIVAELRAAILSGALPPGSPIRDAALASRLGTSITPVREALTQLIAEGLVDAQPNKSRTVANISDEEASDLMEYFGILICAVIRLIDSVPQVEAFEVAREADDFAASLEGSDIDEVMASFRALTMHFIRLCPNTELGEASSRTLTRVQHRVRNYPSQHLYGLWQETSLQLAEELRADRWREAHSTMEEHFVDLLARMRSQHSE